jgi:hypothetical protein
MPRTKRDMELLMNASIFAALAALVFVAACATRPSLPSETSEQSFVVEEALVGQSTARGEFRAINGVRRGFTAHLNGVWDGRALTLVEDFEYDDGQRDRKTWRLERVAPGEYVGTREDVVGQARGCRSVGAPRRASRTDDPARSMLLFTHPASMLRLGTNRPAFGHAEHGRGRLHAAVLDALEDMPLRSPRSAARRKKPSRACIRRATCKRSNPRSPKRNRARAPRSRYLHLKRLARSDLSRRRRVVAAVDAVMAGEDDMAFCAVRPPGHHAEPMSPMGFCIFNNVAIGALHALEAHGLDRVAVVDFDVHHGNGTQTIAESNRA